MTCFEEKLRTYASLIVRFGVNIQKGQEMVLRCPAEAYQFGRMLTEEAYKAGAKEVIVQWRDSVERRLWYDHAPTEVMENFPEWKAASLNDYAQSGAAFVTVVSDDPEIFKGVDDAKMRAASKASNEACKYFYKRMMASEIQWNVAAVPNEAWALKVFPELDAVQAVEKLWDAIFRAVHITDDTDAVKAWEQLDETLSHRCHVLNQYAFDRLIYKNSLGTDFTVGLVQNHIWEGGSEFSGSGVRFFANMPTEEIFTMPDCRRAEGTLKASMPLCYDGTLIHDFSITFHEGKVTEFSAAEGQEVLQRIIETDEGAGRLGEVALVPYHSPISQMGLLFYETLFDENASCHFALGASYPTTVKDGASMNSEQLTQIGGNDSAAHVDFMVGTQDLEITGITKDGKEVAVFKNGDWCLD